MNGLRAVRLSSMLMLAAVLLGCSPHRAPVASAAPPSKASLVLQPCQLGTTPARCGTLQVYEDRAKRTGRLIGLRVAVLKATSPRPAPDAIFYLAGGPGGAATEDGARQQFPSSLLFNHDIVFVDQRGTGASNAVAVPAWLDFAGPYQSDLDRQIKAWVSKPLIDKDMNARFYTTSVAMDDLDDVREALGYDQINLVGYSYGATAAQYYLRQHEEHVRTAFLGLGSLLDIPVFERHALNGQRALDLVFDECKADAKCHAAYPNLREEFEALWRRAAEQPATITFPDKALGSATLTPEYLAPVIRMMTKDGRHHPAIPYLIHRAYAHSDWDGFAQFIAFNGNLQWWGPQVMEHVIRCGEKWARFDPDEVARLGEGSYLNEADMWLAGQQAAACQHVPGGVMPEGMSAQPASQVPVLLMNSQVDPIEPPDNVVGAGKLFPNSTSLVLPYQAHSLSDPVAIACLWSIQDEFIQSGSARGLQTGCLDEIRPPVFNTGK